MKKLWGGRFEKTTAPEVEAFTCSLDVDRRLYAEDIQGSKAHAKMLAKQKLISDAELQQILTGLESIQGEIESGEFHWDPALEDVHMNIEKRLTDRIGAAGGKLHTARSRNDQVALDMRLYVRKRCTEISAQIRSLQEVILEKAELHVETILPGYTHLQRAQPVVLGHHLMAYFWMLQRDWERLQGVYARTNWMPLGSGALAGTTLPIDREFVAKELGFEQICPNSLDAVSDRDYQIEFAAFAAIAMMHLSRWCEELVLWSSQEFSFIEMDDTFSTGSSLMPQKKNPDVAEIIRGKSARSYGNLMALLSLLKSLPLSYNRDLQEDKEMLFDSIDTIEACLRVFTPMLASLKIKTETMRQATALGYMNATDLADYLVQKGIPFRDAHEISGRAVRLAITKKCPLEALSLSEFQSLNGQIDKAVYDHLKLEHGIQNRNSTGGTAPEQVRKQIAQARKIRAD